jgi:hypothetical protein
MNGVNWKSFEPKKFLNQLFCEPNSENEPIIVHVKKYVNGKVFELIFWTKYFVNQILKMNQLLCM